MTDEKIAMAMINITVCYVSKKPQSKSDYRSNLEQIKAIGATISTGYRWKYESRKKNKRATRN